MRGAKASAAAIIAVMTLSIASAAYASDDARAAETRLAYLQNRDRTAFGRPALKLDAFLSRLARTHAQNMAAAGRIWHDPDLPWSVGEWEHVGDNVGRSTNIDSLHAGFMASSEHRDNLMFRAYEQYGVGAAIAPDGRVYAAVVFFTPYRGPASAGAGVRGTRPPVSAGQSVRPPAQTIEMLREVLALDGGAA